MTMLDEATSTTPTQRMRATMTALRLSFTWLGTRKSLSTDQRSQAAEAFGAEGKFLSAGKKLIDTNHPLFKAVTSVRTRAVQLWRSLSLPFPEPGIRLIKQDDISLIVTQLTTLRGELDQAVEQLDAHYHELKSAARERLGRLYSSNDYPVQLTGLFAMEWDFPSVEPPPYLRQLSPELYRQECQRMQARFEEAVQLAEAAFLEELNSLVSHLTDRLGGSEDGKPKVFRDSAVENLTDFFQRFRKLNIGSNQELDSLVDQAQQVVRGVNPQQLRDNYSVRQAVATQLSGVQSVLDGLLVDRPRRAILRRPH